MKTLLFCYRFLLFFIVTWTVYNTTLLFCFINPLYTLDQLGDDLFAYSNMYLLGALDFHKFITGVSQLFGIIFAIHNHIGDLMIVIYVLLVNFTALYAWCRRQNPITAFGLAAAPWFLGPYTPMILGDWRLGVYVFASTLGFYLLLLIANNYRRKHYPDFRLPNWLQWWHPDLMPSLESIGDWMSSIFKKRNKSAS